MFILRLQSTVDSKCLTKCFYFQYRLLESISIKNFLSKHLCQYYFLILKFSFIRMRIQSKVECYFYLYSSNVILFACMFTIV